MSVFKHYFSLEDGGVGHEHAVCCPFPHLTPGGLTYYESNPSAHINLEKDVFHCKVCGRGFNSSSFLKEILGCNYASAVKLSNKFTDDRDKDYWVNSVAKLDQEAIEYAAQWKITPQVLNQLNVTFRGHLTFPVFMWDKLIDYRSYEPTEEIKVRSEFGAVAGLVVPFDVWMTEKDNRVTIIAAGEKDMAVARSHGFSAITFTGGEMVKPIVLEQFRGTSVAICYDHDHAGIMGAIKLAIILQDYCASVKVVTLFHEVCVNDKEDITDFFVKYNKTREDLISYIERTPEFEVPQSFIDNEYPLVSLIEASTPKYVNRLVRTNVQVVATTEEVFTIPSAVIAKKYKMANNGKDYMKLDEVREWTLEDDNAKDLLYLLDNNLKEEDIKANLHKLMKIAYREPYVHVQALDKVTIFKAYVTDAFETKDDTVTPLEYLVYSVGIKLESGKKYQVMHKLVTHPFKGNKLVMVVVDSKQANDSVSTFEVNDITKEHLKVFTELPGTVPERMQLLSEKAKGLIGYNGNNLLITTIDLAYHTPLYFNFGTFINQRAYLDSIIVGESRVGKSSTAEALRNTYELGVFTSLAGNSATVSGIIGGSNKVGTGGFQTRAGLIPQNHRGLIIFEEFGKCRSDIATELTDIRSSNEVRITRVSGTMSLPAMVRMISLTNVKQSGADIKPIASFPHGISIITDLIGSAEDIARYDIMLVLGDRGNDVVDPFWRPENPMTNEQYKTRIRWIWSREAEQIVFDDTVDHYLYEKANELNRLYSSHIKIFGTEAWKKLARVAIATAGYLVSTDDSYENIIVKKEHVDYAFDYFQRIYDNSTFKLRQYVEHERKYSTIDQDGITFLQQLFANAPGMLLHLEQESKTNRMMLLSASGLPSQDAYNGMMNKLLSGMFVKLSGNDIYPTERFRLGMARINRAVRVQQIGEISNVTSAPTVGNN